LRTDPAAVLLVLRQTAPVLHVPTLSFFPALLREPSVCEEALRLLEQPAFVDWNEPAVEPVYRASLAYAGVATRLAEHVTACDPENAWVAGLLAPLGWLAASSVDGAQVGGCLANPAFPPQPARVEQRLWGLDLASIARRLARRWRLPRWLAIIVGHLGLPAEVAQTLGADATLFRVVQLAVALAQQHGAPLRLPVGGTTEELAAGLGLPAELMAALEREAHALTTGPGSEHTWQAPTSVPLLRDLLTLAAENRRLRSARQQDQLEQEVDDLHRAVEAQHSAGAEQLRAQKLSALAEFAAGAGHEINNPLAVISGQAQYLLRSEQEAPRQQALQTIIGQAQRVHEMLRELMQFARPPRPEMQQLDVLSLAREVLTSLTELADGHRVRLIYPEDRPAIHLHADPGQLRTALTCLLRNAIEAAGTDGWASVRLEQAACNQVDVVVEDSGSGPAWQQRQHLFDPFYSGRQAGRGRGLGLPTAWRLAREQGGDVRFVGLPGGPTRFILSLPSGNGFAKEAV
jgi:signal transduction histidine kinase